METKDSGYVALIGLGAIGMPLAYMLSNNLGSRFIVLADLKHANDLTSVPIIVNGERFLPRIIWHKEQLDRPISVLFVCVKNYSLESAFPLINDCIDKNTIIMPLQNGVYSFEFFHCKFPHNIVLEGFSQGPNTIKRNNIYTYTKTGIYHIGTSNNAWENHAHQIYNLLSASGIDCHYDNNIKHEVWKKYMLNVAGNALTALTQIDYSMFSLSEEAQHICKKIMEEFRTIAGIEGIEISNKDINDIMEYFIHYGSSKHTSMLEDVLNQRKTENDYIAGHIVDIAQKNGINVPATQMIYELMKIREDVYMGKLFPERV